MRTISLEMLNHYIVKLVKYIWNFTIEITITSPGGKWVDYDYEINRVCLGWILWLVTFLKMDRSYEM